MADTSWVVLGAGVGYGGIVLYAAALTFRARRTRRTLAELRRRST